MFPYLLEHARKLETFRKFRYCFLKHKEVCMLPVSLGILKLTSKFPYFLIFHIYAYIYMFLVDVPIIGYTGPPLEFLSMV